MHYIFQHVLKFSTLQISTYVTDFNTRWNFQHAFSRCFQHISNMKFTYGMNHVEKCIENHVKYFKVYWKPCWHFQSVSKITVTWPLCDPFHQFWNIIAVIKIKSDIINKDYRSLWCYMWSVIEILCGIEEKIGLVCMQLLHNVRAMENF